ncbi:MAG: DUF3786 domain-containing protein [Desulfococcaceae bacterium]
MALSVVDLYRDILPKTNCRDCGFPTCLAFASMVVSEKHPLENCPHLSAEVVEKCRKELEAQYAAGKWTKRDMSEDALLWANNRAASMKIEDLPERIGGTLIKEGDGYALRLPYFTGAVLIRPGSIVKEDGEELSRWEQVFLLNHMAQGGRAMPAGKWKTLQEFPNTVSKIKSMRSHVEEPLVKRFGGKKDELVAAALSLGGKDIVDEHPSADAAFLFTPLPRIPVILLFWDREGDEFEAKVSLLFDETITVHLDIESIMFLSERLRQLLCGDEK